MRGGVVIIIWVEEPKRKSSQGRGTALGNEPDEEGSSHQNDGKIKVGGDEAMEPNLESLGERRGGATQGIIYIVIIIT